MGCMTILHTFIHGDMALFLLFFVRSRMFCLVLGKMHIEDSASRIFGLLTMWVVDESCELCIEYEYALVGDMSCTVSQLGAALPCVGGKE